MSSQTNVNRINIRRLLGKWKLKSRKLATNRLSQLEQLEARRMFVAAVWTNVLQPLDVSKDPESVVSPLDALLVINELNHPVYGPRSQPLPLEIPDNAAPPPFIDVSCDGIVSPLDVLLVINRLNARDVPAGTTPSSGKPSWHFANAGGSNTAQGKYVYDACSPRLIEGNSFLTQLSASVTLPDATSAIKVRFDAPSFDASSQRTIRDALEILVLDQAGQPLVLPYSPGRDAAFNWSEGLTPVPGPAVQFVTGTVTINLAGTAAGSTVHVIARLANNDQDNNSAVTIRGIEIVDSQTAPPNSYQPTARTNASKPFDFASLSDVSGSLQINYGDTALSEDDASVLSSNLQVLNSGSYPIAGTLVAVLSNLSDPAVGLVNPDGFTADGRPYLNLTQQMGESLAPGATTTVRSIQFKNPSRDRFSYAFTMLSGLNQLPTILPLADALIGVGDTFAAQIKASDPEQQPLTYSLIARPAGMTINANTGVISWTPSSSDVGSVQVRFQVSDSLGGMTQRYFTVDVRETLANRPPIITSTPETDAVVSSPFEVQTYATGLGPLAVDVLKQTNGSMSLITANQGEQQLGYLAGSPRKFGSSQSISIGEPNPSILSTPFTTAYPVELGLAPNTLGDNQRDIQGVLTGDVNSDGNPDLIVLASLFGSGNWNDANNLGHVIVRLGNGEGTFREGWQASLPVVAGRIGRAASAHLNDVTGDGRLDLIVTTIATNQTLVYPGNATSLFDATPIVSANSGNYVANTQMADLNADGKLDLIFFENDQVQIGGRQGIGIQLGAETGRFSGTTLLAAANNYGGHGYVVDVDGVNGPDLVRLNYNDTRLEVRLNNGTGQFGDVNNSPTRSYFNSDNTGGRNINPTTAYVDDFDGDGKADALVSSPTGVALLKGQGNGLFGNGTQSGNAVVVNSNFDDPNWPGIVNSDGRGKDLNGDGKIDFVFGDTNNAGNIMIGLGSGTGSFGLKQYNASFDDDIGQGIVKLSRTTQFLAVADFNRDGVMDMAVGASQRDQRPAAVGTFLGDQPGTLRAPNFVNSYAYNQNYDAVKARSGESVTGDFNGDGYVDIVTMGGAGYGAAFFFAAGKGDGTFAPYETALGGIQGYTSLISLDIDRDGKLDLAWMDGGRFGQAFGLGNGAFQYLPTIPSQGAGPGGVSNQILQTDDFNRDGYPDLVYRLQTGNIDTNISTKIVVLIYDPLNRRYRELPDASNLITLTPRAYGFYHDEALGMGDLNNDGVKEFFAFSRNNPNNGTPSRFAIYEQTGSVGNDASIMFRKTVIENPSFIAGGQAIDSYVVDDFNQDGKNDIAYSTGVANTVVMFGNEDFTFRDPTTYLTNSFLINGGDFNGDGLTDLATTWGYGFLAYSQRPYNSVLLGRADGTFSQQYGFTTATSSTNGLFVGDFNGDGVDDLTGLGGLKHNEAFIGKTKGLSDIATGDFNGDGRPDSVTVVAGLDRVKLLHGVVDETFARQPDLLTDLFPVAVEVVDADHDDLLDILTANQVGKSLSLFKHTSPTTYARTDIDLPVRPTELVLGDLNGDGKNDAIAISSLDQTLVSLLAGNDTFGISHILPLGFSPSGVAAGDVSGDGKLDLVLSDSVGDRLIVLQGRGDGTFAAPFVIPAIHAPGAMGIADMNADGRPDIVVAQPEDDRVALFFNRGSGRFTSPQLIQVGDKPVAIRIRDVNNDNKPDLLVPNQDENTISVILNRFDLNQVWIYKPTATDPDGDVVTFDLTSAPGGMLYDSASNTIFWAPMPEQIGSNSVVLTASDGNGGSTDQGFTVTVTAPVSVVPPIFTSTPVTTFGADSVYRYEPNVQAEENGPKRFSLVQGPAGMNIDPTTGVLEWDNRSQGIKLFANYADPGSPVSNRNNGQIQIPDSLSLRSASVTAEGWFNFEDPKGALWDQLLSKQIANVNSSTPSWGLEYYYGTLRAHVGKPGLTTSLATVTAPAPIEFNTWTHIALTFDDSSKRLTLYVNGKNIGSAISPESIGYNAQPLVSGSNYIALSRVKVWNTVRSESAIAAQALADIPSNTPGLVLDLKFRESKVVSTILDASNSKNHGSLIGTPDFVNFPNRVPALASQGSYPVTIRVEDGKGGVSEQSFSISVKAPTTTQVTGTVFDDLNGNGLWDRRSGENLVFNGDFGSGAVGFTTDFVQRNNSSAYGWLGNAQSTVSNVTSPFPITSDYRAHTDGSASDLMLLANGDTQDRVAWRQSIPTVNGQSYAFSFWAIRANSYEAPRLAVRVNGQVLGTTLSLNEIGLNGWKQFIGTLQANSSTTLVEIVLLGSATAPNPGLGGAENVVGIDDILFLPSVSRRAIVSGKANPYLAGMPEGSTAFGGTAPQASPPSVAVAAGQVLRFATSGQTISEGGFIRSRSSEGSVYTASGLVTQSALNGISQFSAPFHGSLIGVFLDDSSPAGQTPPAALDFRATGNVPGGVNYTSLQPVLRQVFFLGDGRTDVGAEQSITVPGGATRLFFANSSSFGWNSNSGEFEVQVFESVSEPVQANRRVFVDSNFNGRLDASEPSTQTNSRGVYALPIPGTSAQLGLVGKENELQTAPGIPYRTFDIQTDVLPIDFGSRDTALNESPRFTTQPITTATAPGDYRYQSFAQSPSGKPMTYALAVGPQGMSIDPSSGLVRWNPIASNRGDNEVILKASDADGKLTLQRYTIKVEVNTLPIVTSLPPTTALQSIPFEYQVLAQDAEQLDLRYSLTAAPVGMTIEAASGLIRWLPSSLGTENVTVEIEDQKGGVASHAFSLAVQVAGTNRAPELMSVPLVKAIVGREFASRIGATDEDNDVLSYTLVSGPNGLTVSSHGEIFWQPSLVGSFDFVARVSDSRGGSDEQTYALTVLSRAPTPDLQIISSPTTAAVVGAIFAYDVVAKNGELFELVTSPAGMSISAARGTIRWVPTKDQLGVQTVKVRVSDLLGNMAEQSFVVAVRTSSLVPTISSAPLTEGAVGQTYVYAVAVANPSKSPLTYSLRVAPAGMQMDAALGVITWTPNANQIGPAVVSIQVRDAVGNFSSQTFSVLVLAGASNRPPVAVSTASIDAVVGQPYVYTMVANDPEGGTVNFALRSAPSGFSMNPSTGVVTWTPSTTDVGTVSIVLTATDPVGGIAVQSIQIDVRAANRLPVVRSNPTLKVSPGATYQYDVVATDDDREPLFYSLVTAPAGMTIDALGRMRWQTQLDTPLGGRDVAVRVVDGLGGAATQSFTFGVVADTLAPRITIIVGGEPVLYPWTSAPAIVRVIAADDVGLKSVELKVDGQSVALAADGTARVYFSAPGNGRLEAIATDAAGNRGTALARVSMRSGEEDGGGNPAPEAKITSVTDGVAVGGFVDVIGTAAAPDFEHYVLSYRRTDQSSYKTILSGTTQVTAGSLGKWDTTLLENDNYVLKLEVYDTFGSFAAVEVEVGVSGNLKLGNFQISFTDITIPVAGIPITLARTYDTLRADREGDFGFGWRLEYRNTDLRTSLPKSGLEDIGIYTPFKSRTRVSLTLPGGLREGFTFTPEFRVLPGFGRNNSLVVAFPRFTSDRGVRSTLSAGSGTLLVNAFGEMYAAGGVPWNPANPEFGGYTLTTEDGTRYAIDGSTGLMTTVKDRNGNTISFSDSGVKSSNGGLELAIERDVHGRISSVTDPNGNSIRYRYSNSGDLLGVRDRVGNETSFRYLSSRPHYLESVIDPLGRLGVKTEYGADGRLKTSRGRSSRVDFAFDLDRLEEELVDANGNTFRLGYDFDGNLVSIFDALGNESRMTYDSRGLPISKTNPLGQKTRYEYDANGRLIKQTDPLGFSQLFQYDQAGNQFGFTNANGEQLRFELDGRGNVTARIDAAGSRTEYELTANGLIASVRDALGGVTRNKYNIFGFLEQMTDAGGNATTFVYDAVANELSRSRMRTTSSGPVVVKESRKYDANGNLIEGTDAEGKTTKLELDFAGSISAQIDPLNRRTEFQLTASGYVQTTKHPDGSITHQELDAEGRPIAYQGRAGARLGIRRDEMGQVIEFKSPDNTPNPDDNPSRAFTYDALGRLSSFRDESGQKFDFAFDTESNGPTSITDSQGTSLRRSYDAIGQLTSSTAPNGVTIQNSYDIVGNLVNAKAGNGPAMQQTFDALGRLTSRTDASGRRTVFQYDPLGQLSSVIDPGGSRIDYTYDELGNRTSHKDSLGRLTRFEYDNLGRVTQVVLPSGEKSLYEYDAVGRLMRVSEFDGKERSYGYDLNDRIIQKQQTNIAKVEIQNGPNGLPVRVTDERGTATYEYDVLDRLTARREADGAFVLYTYDIGGNISSIQTPGELTAYTYDANKRLTSVSDQHRNLTRYSYNDEGQLLSVEFPTGIKEVRSYTENGLLASIVQSKANDRISSYEYVRDPVGRIESVRELDGTVRSFRYDATGRLALETISKENHIIRTIEHFRNAAGDVVRLADSVAGTTTYEYDNAGRLSRAIKSGVSENFRYDANGNLVSRGTQGKEPTVYTWSPEGRLLKVVVPGIGGSTSIRYGYDYKGNRVSRTVNGVETKFLVDDNREHVQVLRDYTNSGPVTDYTFGLERISQSNVNQILYFMGDGHSGTRLLTDADGSTLEQFAYTAYGKTIAGDEERWTRFLYNGESRDSTTNLDDLRARSYDSTTGRFISRDQAGAAPGDLINLPRYQYAGGDPVNLRDPSGEFVPLIAAVLGVVGIGVLEGSAFAIALGVLEFAAGVLGGMLALKEAAYVSTGAFKGGVHWQGPMLRASAEAALGIEFGISELSAKIPATAKNRPKTRTTTHFLIGPTVGLSLKVGVGIDTADLRSPDVPQTSSPLKLNGLYFRGWAIGAAFLTSVGVGTVQHGQAHGFFYSKPGNPFAGTTMGLPDALNFGGGFDFATLGWSYYMGYEDNIQ